MTGMKKRLAVAAFATGMVAMAGMVMASGMMKGGAEGGPIAERKMAMKEAKKNFKPLVGMVKGKVAFDAAVVKAHAKALMAALEKAKANFPEGSDKGETRAKPEIWLMKEEFNALFDKAITLAGKIEGADTKEKLAKAVMALGNDGCKACHKEYRLPKKKKM